jgi:hypothetical protein
MSYTLQSYTFSLGTSAEANSVTDVTSVLNLLLDNTSKQISPRDIRDAIVSTWENSPFRYTSDGATNYIGIDRVDVKDLKVFLGKKQMSGTNIMSSGLLSSDTDIFLYNTKSDSASSNDLKVSFLAGTSSSLFLTAPYIKSKFVNGSPDILSLEIVNPSTYGTINIESGASASIFLNNLIWPNQTYINDVTSSPGSASASTNTDLFLVISSGNSIELKTYQAGVGAVQASQDLNSNPLLYTNLSPIVATISGIGVGSTFSNVSLIDMISAIIYPYLGPLALVSISGLSYNNTFEKDTTSGYTLNYNYTLTKRSNNITSTALKIIRQTTTILTTSGSSLSGSGLVSNSYSGAYTITSAQISGETPNSRNFYTFSCSPFDGTSGFTASVIFESVLPYFYGFSSTNTSNGITLNGTVLPSLTKRVDAKMGLTLSLAGSGFLYFCYPSFYGTVSSIKDGNDFTEYSHGGSSVWTYSVNFPINSPTGKWNGQTYYFYRKTLSSTISPSQNYKFNF